MNPPAELHPAVLDLQARLAAGEALGGALLHDAERATLDRVRALPPEPALLLARLVARRPRAFRVPDLVAAGVEDVEGAVIALLGAGLASLEVPDALRLLHARVEVLKSGCRRLGLPVGGDRAALVARLVGQEGWDDAPWVRLTCGALVERVERWATLQVEPDRAAPVLERMGTRRYVDHPVTGGSIVRRRSAWDLWEAVVDGPVSAEAALALLTWASWPPGGLDLRSELDHLVRDAAATCERTGALADALRLLDARLRVARPSATVEVRRALVRERLGQHEEALRGLMVALEHGEGPGRRALLRTARRLARGQGHSLPPDPPSRAAPVRTLALRRVEAGGHRPRYGAAALRIEEAVSEMLHEAGRRVLPGEGGLLSTLAALLFVDVQFLPVPGQLPTPRRTGPLDLGTPAFAARRAGAIWEVLDAIRGGAAPERVAAAQARHGEAWIAGADPGLATDPALVDLAEAIGPDGLVELLRPWLAQGRAAWAGVPDLVVLPGPAVRVQGLHPASLGEGLLWVEVKGEQDVLRDAQHHWHDRLLRAGQDVQVWKVPPLPKAP